MAGITMSADLYITDSTTMKRAIQSFMQQEMTKAVKLFLQAALVRIPRRTGFLRGSFTEITKFFNVPGTGAGESGYATKTEYYYHTKKNRILKTPTSGTQFATPPKNVLRRLGNQIVFTLDSEIRYFAANDFGAGVPGAPWRSLSEGLAEMTNYLEGSPGRFPDIERILTRIFIKSSGGSTTVSKTVPNIDGIFATRELMIEGFS